MGSLYILFSAVVLASAAYARRPFNEPGYRCNGGAGWQHVRVQQNGFSDQVTTSSLRRPQFFPCPVNHSRDHVIELQVAKAYLLEDHVNSLSCATVNWLNTRANMRCLPQELNALKGEWFREVLTLDNQRCAPDHENVMSFILLFCFSGANVTCRSAAAKGGKEKPLTCEGIPLGENCCCNFSDKTIEAEKKKSIFSELDLRTNLPAEVREDLLELQRFLYYRVHQFCAGYNASTNYTSTTVTSTTTSGVTQRPQGGISMKSRPMVPPPRASTKAFWKVRGKDSSKGGQGRRGGSRGGRSGGSGGRTAGGGGRGRR